MGLGVVNINIPRCYLKEQRNSISKYSNSFVGFVYIFGQMFAGCSVQHCGFHMLQPSYQSEKFSSTLKVFPYNAFLIISKC